MKIGATLAFIVVLATSVRADLMVTTEPVKVAGQEAIVKLDMRNTFKRKVESARAAVFLMDQKGVVVGHAVKWVITGQKNLPALPPGGTNQFNFVVPLNKPVAGTNLTAKVQFNRVICDNGRLANIPTEVSVTETGK
jgi:hypothetical protein